MATITLKAGKGSKTFTTPFGVTPNSVTVNGSQVGYSFAYGVGTFDTALNQGDVVEVTYPTPLTTPGEVDLRTNVGPQTYNPFEGPYPEWVQGIGGTGFYDTKPLANNALYLPIGAASFANPRTYGSLNTTMGLTAIANTNRPGLVMGLTNPAQVSGYDEFGSCALGAAIDSMPLMHSAAGTFTSTTFTPSTPIPLSDDVWIGVGMWLRTDDYPARFNGQVVSWDTASQVGLTDPTLTISPITKITVSGWFKRGGSQGTPTGARIFMSPQDKVWGHLNNTLLGYITKTGASTNGSTVVAVDTTDGIYPGGQFISGTGIQPGTIIQDCDYDAKVLNLSKPATATLANQTYTISCGTEFNKGVAAEVDIFNGAADFIPVYIQDTGDIANGSYEVTVSNISQWRPGLAVYGSVVGFPNLTYVTKVNASNNKITLKHPCTATATGVALKAINMLDECGLGWDMVSVLKNAQAGFVVRGSFSWGYISHGAAEASFLCRPDLTAALPKFGFQVDTKLNGTPTVAPFALTNHDTVIAGVLPDGAVQGTSFKVGSAKVLDNDAWTAYTPTVNAGAAGVVGTVNARYKKIGRTVHAVVEVTVTTADASLGAVYITLPVNTGAGLTAIGSGRNGSTGKSLVAFAPASNNVILVQDYTGAYPVASGQIIQVSITYES